jgi:hypothetical protein
MAFWDNKKYDDEATRIAKTFNAGQGQNGASLTDLVEKTARQNGLNPEQIRRLSRVANIRAWEEKFAGMKAASAPDRNVEFELTSENEVIRRLHGDAAAMVSTAIKTASGDAAPAQAFPDLQDAMDEVRRPLPKESGTYKKASVEPVDLLRPRRPDMELLKLQTLADQVDVKIASARFAWRDAMQGLLDESRKITWTPAHAAEFEKAAVSLHGLSVVPEINALRRMRGEPVLPLTNEKVAALRDRIYAEPTPATDLVKAAAEARKEHSMLENARQTVEKKMESFRSLIGVRKVGG